MQKSMSSPLGVLVLTFLLLSISGTAQRSIIGTVVESNSNLPLEGATVYLKNSKRDAVVTKEDGRFQLSIPTGKTILNVSFIGYQEQFITLSENENTVVVRLIQNNNQMSEVVVIGVQSQTRRKTTSAISTVTAKDIENLPSPSVDQLLQGRVAGLNVQISSGEPGVAPTIVVRGNSSVRTDIGDRNVAQAKALSGPLYVIDGVPISADDISNGLDVTGTNFLAGININDIESVDVQKDAAATAAWGSRGANGVIYIKTKAGVSSKPEFRFNVYHGINIQPDLLNLATGAAEREQKMEIINQYAEPDDLFNLPQVLTDRFNPYFNNATDWQGLFYRNGQIQNADVTVSAATKAVNYRVSMNYFNEKGIIQATGFTRYSMRGSFNFNISPKLNSQFIVAISKSDRKRGTKTSNGQDNTPISGYGVPSSFYRVNGFDSSNFTGLYSKLRNKNINDNYSASFTLNYSILPELKYTFQGSANITSSYADYFSGSDINAIAASQGRTVTSYAQSDKGTFSSYFISNTLNYNKKIEGENRLHNFVLTGSQQFNTNIINSSSVFGSNVPSNDIQVVSGIPQTDIGGFSNYAADGLLSVSGQLQYDLDGKYLLYGSYRGDASSRFGNNSKWGKFPAFGAGWILTEEPFMEGIAHVVPFLKLRASYGTSGKQSSDFYAPYNSYIIPGTYNGGVAFQPSYNNGLTKNNLTWAKTTQKNIGVDAQLFGSRVNLSVDLYEKLSKDDYFDLQLPFYTGFGSINFNANDLWVSNKGVDITLSAKVLHATSPLQWNTQLTISHNKNLIAKLPNDNRTFILADNYGTNRLYAVGQPIYTMFQLKYLGVYNDQSEIPFNPITGDILTYHTAWTKVSPGFPKFLDVDNSGDAWSFTTGGNFFSADGLPMGDPNPMFTGGWSNSFSYKNFSFSFLGIFTWKRTVINTFLQRQISYVVENINTFAHGSLPDLSEINYWTPQKAKSDPNYKADFPTINPFGGNYGQFNPVSSMFNEDGSYFKVKNITAGYQIPQSLMKRVKIKNARLYSIVENVLTITKSTMPNPELVDQLGVYTGGLYPLPTRFTIGIDIQF